MRQIAADLNLDYENDIHTYRPTLAKYLLCDEKFGYQDGLHEPQKLLLLGFMYC